METRAMQMPLHRDAGTPFSGPRPSKPYPEASVVALVRLDIAGRPNRPGGWVIE